jgi:F0F1-type ATP synthase membrane subunit c/vacuolar-type H+-ATPase subunit K
MKRRKLFEWAGIAAGVVLIAFGIGAIAMSVDGRNTVQDSLKAEQITFGDASDPAVAKYAKQWAGEQVTTGEQARAFAKIMRMHTVEASSGLTYAQMGRYVSAARPDDPAGTSDEAAAAKDTKGQPISNPARNLWVTETALTTALNVSYMAEQLSLFGLIVGIALLLSGIGFVVLALAALGGVFREKADATVTTVTPVASH